MISIFDYQSFNLTVSCFAQIVNLEIFITDCQITSGEKLLLLFLGALPIVFHCDVLIVLSGVALGIGKFMSVFSLKILFPLFIVEFPCSVQKAWG